MTQMTPLTFFTEERVHFVAVDVVDSTVAQGRAPGALLPVRVDPCVPEFIVVLLELNDHVAECSLPVTVARFG